VCQSQPRMYRHHFYACIAPRQAPLVHAATDKALQEVGILIDKLMFYFTEYWSGRGVAPAVEQLLKDMASCWDFRLLTQQAPTPEQKEAFLRVARTCREFVQHAAKPHSRDIGCRVQPWPSASPAGDHELRLQYERLCLCCICCIPYPCLRRRTVT